MVKAIVLAVLIIGWLVVINFAALAEPDSKKNPGAGVLALISDLWVLWWLFV